MTATSCPIPSGDSRNVLIAHCACGAMIRFDANTNSGILLKTDASPWGIAEHDAKCGGHCRGVCPTCKAKPPEGIS